MQLRGRLRYRVDLQLDSELHDFGIQRRACAEDFAADVSGRGLGFAGGELFPGCSNGTVTLECGLEYKTSLSGGWIKGSSSQVWADSKTSLNITSFDVRVSNGDTATPEMEFPSPEAAPDAAQENPPSINPATGATVGPGVRMKVDAGIIGLGAGYDANVNIIVWSDGGGTLIQQTDYAPFGNATIMEKFSAKADNLPAFGFSTKPSDKESGLYYYGHGYYDPMTGRWPSRDSIWESGGVNLFGFVAIRLQT